MTALFADTSFFIAFLNADDQAYTDAYTYMTRGDIQMLTSEWVLLELGNYLSRRAGRERFGPLVDDLETDQRFRIVTANRDDFQDGLGLYHQRQDKHWSMTDCISFSLMEREGITDALTSDHHFEQAGFRVLLGN
ncbi:MAG TPA: PIN domain-containing protein [Pirellulales bacterium]|nr:PIN domain-containing protein [Pirellulales bacterium]